MLSFAMQDSIFGGSPTPLHVDDDSVFNPMPSPPHARPRLADSGYRAMPTNALNTSSEEPEILRANSPEHLPRRQPSPAREAPGRGEADQRLALKETQAIRRKEPKKKGKKKTSLMGTPATGSLTSCASDKGGVAGGDEGGVAGGEQVDLTQSGSSGASRGHGVFYAGSSGTKAQEEGGKEAEEGEGKMPEYEEQLKGAHACEFCNLGVCVTVPTTSFDVLLNSSPLPPSLDVLAFQGTHCSRLSRTALCQRMLKQCKSPKVTVSCTKFEINLPAHAYTTILTHAHTHACTHTCTHVRTYAHTHTRTHTHAHTYTDVQVEHPVPLEEAREVEDEEEGEKDTSGRTEATAATIGTLPDQTKVGTVQQ